MSPTKKRPCRNCKRWFYPDPRVGGRQRTCGKAECQAERRRQTQANWRRRNLGYGVGYRIDQRHCEGDSDAELLQVPAPLNKLPWDIAKDQFGGKGADFIAVMGKYLLRGGKDQSLSYPIESNGVACDNPPLAGKTRAEGAHTETQATPNHAANSGVSPIGSPPGASPGPPPGPLPAVAGITGRDGAADSHHRHPTSRAVSGHRRPPTHCCPRTVAAGYRRRHRLGFGERSRSPAAGALSAQ